ncbi:hypothetical protein [Streptomyces sp. NPDC059015]|uniref:hypothetical protein n=1 Tax=unclassified Streptomyces TaxID=2593676 RepID=UPI00367F7825
MTTTTHPTTAHHLWTIARHWTDLADALTAQQNTWPPAMGIAVLSNRHQTAEEREAAQWRAQALRQLERSPDQPGWTAAPIRFDVLDALLLVEAGLVELADQIAAASQHSPITPSPPRKTWPANPRAYKAARADANRRDLLALRQSKDPRRWRLMNGPDADRTAVRAALWLLARYQGVRGPWRPLSDDERARIRTVARACAHLVERCLDVGDGRATLAESCPLCGDRLVMHGGAGASPVVRCRGASCGRTWTWSDVAR